LYERYEVEEHAKYREDTGRFGWFSNLTPHRRGRAATTHHEKYTYIRHVTDYFSRDNCDHFPHAFKGIDGWRRDLQGSE
jgi:hypothetical protein